MSNCLVLQGKNFIAIGADTASSILIDGKYRRIGTDAKKLYRFGNEIMFCSGRMALVELVTSNIVMKDNKIVLNSLTDFIKSLSIQKADTYDLEVLICGVENNKSYMHQISQYNDFEVKTVTNDTSGCAVYSTGFNAKTMLDTTKKNYGLCKNISDLFIKSFTDISSDEVGGYINMYLVQENQITKCVDSQKVDDVESISVSNYNIHFVIADCLIGDMIIGETLLVANSTGTFIVDKDGIIVKNMKLDMSNADGSRRIVIDPELDSILSVYTNSKQVFYVDINGNMCMLGNLYVNNNNMYLKVDMTADNIIEVGYGEITGTGNEGEAGEGGSSGGVSTGNYVETPWIRSTDGLNIVDLYDGEFSTTTNSSDVKKITHNKLIEKDGNVYFIEGYNLKKFNKQSKKWDTISTLSTYTPVCFVRTNRDDNNLYVCSEYYSNYRIHQFNLDDSKWSIVCVLHGSTSDYTNYLHDVFMDGTMVHLFGYSPDYSNKYYTLGTEDSRGALAWTGVETNGIFIHRVIPYNNKIYAIYINNNANNSSSFGEITNLKTRTIKFIASLDSNCTNYLNVNQYCFTVMDDMLYIFCSFVGNTGKYYTYNLKTETFSENTNAPLLECSNSISYGYHSGVCVFNDGEDLHLYNGIIADNSNYSKYSGYNWYASFDRGYIYHYIYNENNKIEVNKNFKELDSGKGFINTLQNGYCVIGDKIFASNCTYNFTANNYGLTNQILCLDTSQEDAEWQVLYTTTELQIISLVQSNASDKVYFCYASRSLGILSHAYYDLTNNIVMFFQSGIATGGYTSEYSGIRITDHNLAVGDYAYIDEESQRFYRVVGNNVSYVNIYPEGTLSANKSTVVTTLSTTPISNIVYKDNYAYFLANVASEKYALYKCNYFNGELEKLTDIFSGYDSDYGFSIFVYNNKVQVYHSYHGSLSHVRYVYDLLSEELRIYDDVFQDEGLYNVHNEAGQGYKTCFLPMIPTSNGVHIFVGYPWFDGTTYNNGGYKHYLYTEGGSTPTDPDDPNNPTPPSVDNPSDKIFYITNTGDGYFYGNVYAKDGIFKGDIIAKSLTLGEGVTLNTSDISGMDDYVLTDVGLGTESGTYCKIGKDGLLTAKNAIISGQANIGEGYIGGWEIGDNGLKSVGFDDTSITNGIRLDKSGEIRSKGSWYSSVDGSGIEGWFSRLCSGKWIFGYYDSTQSDPFVPPTGTPYSDISVNGIYMCSKDTILNKSSQYLFAVDTTNDTVKITNSAKNSPALEITNNGSGASLKIHSVTQGYENRAFDAQVVSSSETSNVVIFGEGDTDVGDRVIFRCDKSVEVLDEDGNPTGTFNHEPSEQGSVGTALRRWNTGYFNSLYSKDEVSTSDAKLKDVIGELDKQQSLEFINSLTPYEYTFKDSKHKRKHMGFLAQSVKDTVVEKNMGDMAIYEATRVDDDGKEYYFKDEYDENELLWGLKYNEFIAPLVGAVQALTKRVEDLEADNEKLRTRIEKLEDASE